MEVIERRCDVCDKVLYLSRDGKVVVKPVGGLDTKTIIGKFDLCDEHKQLVIDRVRDILE